MTVVLHTRFRNCYKEAQNSVGISCCTGPLTLKKWTLLSVISFLHRLADWKVQHQKLDGPSFKFQVWLSLPSTKYSPHCCQYIPYGVHDENWLNNNFLVQVVSKLTQTFKFLRRDFKLWCSSVSHSQSPAERLLAGYRRLWPFLLFSWPFHLRKRYYWKEKLIFSSFNDMGRGGVGRKVHIPGWVWVTILLVFHCIDSVDSSCL